VRILILTQYYLPETGAPQNRLSSLAGYLKKFGNEVEILTALPNYPKNKIFADYNGKLRCREKVEDIDVHRSFIFVSMKNGLLPRLTNYFSFMVSSYYSASIRLKKYDVIICESPPLFLGITAVLLKRKWKCKLVFNVSDLWPESAEKMGIIKNKWIIRRSYKLANWIYRNADMVSGQTKGIIDAVKKMQPKQNVLWFPNGADLNKFSNHISVPEKNTTHFNLLYAGIIGYAQGLEVILYAAEILKEKKDIHFYLIGDGPVKTNLLLLKKQLQLDNVTFIANLPGEKIIQWVYDCDAYIVPLRNLDLFKGAIPSKLFEPLAAGKPILLGVDGEARQLFIDEGESGLFYPPENAKELSECVMKLYDDGDLAKRLGANGKRYVTSGFTRENIAAKFWEELQKL
jgi:glycosyltransferase involved in cell wall biosynthesis